MIRKVGIHDVNELAILMKQLSPYAPDITEDTLTCIEQKLSEIENHDNIIIFGFENDGKIVGTCTVGRIEGISKGCRPFAVIENVVVLDTMRRKGIGTALVRHAIDQAEDWGCYKVILETGSKKEETLRFYDNCGLIRGEKTAFIKRF